MNKREAGYMLLRYLIALILGIFIWIFYIIFTPVTEALSYFMLNAIYPGAVFEGNLIILGAYSIKLIPACIAGAAYYLLFLINMATPMAHLTRIKSLVFLFVSFLGLNVLRIVLFSVLFVNNYKYISFAHEVSWYLGSTVLVVIIWFLNVWAFRIKGRPFIDDVKNILNDAVPRKRFKPSRISS